MVAALAGLRGVNPRVPDGPSLRRDGYALLPGLLARRRAEASNRDAPAAFVLA